MHAYIFRQSCVSSKVIDCAKKSWDRKLVLMSQVPKWGGLRMEEVFSFKAGVTPDKLGGFTSTTFRTPDYVLWMCLVSSYPSSFTGGRRHLTQVQ